MEENDALDPGFAFHVNIMIIIMIMKVQGIHNTCICTGFHEKIG